MSKRKQVMLYLMKEKIIMNVIIKQYSSKTFFQMVQSEMNVVNLLMIVLMNFAVVIVDLYQINVLVMILEILLLNPFLLLTSIIDCYDYLVCRLLLVKKN